MQESETEKRQLQKGTSAESVFSPSKHAVLYQITPIEFALDTAELKGIKKSGCHKLAKALSLPGGSIHPCRLKHVQKTSSASEVNVAATMTTNEMNSDLPSPIQIPPYPWLTMSHHVPPWPTNQAAVAGRDDSSGSATGSTLEVPEMEA